MPLYNTGAPNSDAVLNCCVPFPGAMRRNVKSAAERLKESIRGNALSARLKAAAAAKVDGNNSSDQ